jgi:hypothetical protein
VHCSATAGRCNRVVGHELKTEGKWNKEEEEEEEEEGSGLGDGSTE